MNNELSRLIVNFEENCHDFLEFSRYTSLLNGFANHNELSDCEELDIIKYELNIFNYKISNGNLIKLNTGFCYYDDIHSFDDECVEYLRNKLYNSINVFLQSFYSFLLSHIYHDDPRECNFFFIDYINYSLDIWGYFKNNGFTEEKDFFIIKNILVNILKGFIPKSKFKNVFDNVILFIKDENIGFGLKLHLIELMLTKRKIFKKDGLKFLIPLCWNYAFDVLSTNELAIQSLKIGKSIVNKFNNDSSFEDNHNWNLEIAKNYEELIRQTDENFLLKSNYYIHAIIFYEKAGKDDKANQLSIEFSTFKENSNLSDNFSNDDESMDVYIQHEFTAKSFLDYLIYYNQEPLLPTLIKSNEYYDEYKLKSPYEAVNIKRITCDNNNNIVGVENQDDSYEDKVKKFNYRCYKKSLQDNIKYLNELLISAFENDLWSYEQLLNNLNQIPIFSENIFFNQSIKNLIKPIFEEYFKQFNLFIEDNEPNFMIFIDSIVSKLEFMVRLICKRNELKSINIFAENLTTSEMLLNHIFHEDKFKEFIEDSDLVFLKTILLDDGLNLRNKSAHCLDLSIFSFTNANLLMLCFLRLMKYI